MTHFIVGIDLGTTNTVVAYAERSADPDALPAIFEIEQLVALGEVAARPSLPSLRYHPAPGEPDHRAAFGDDDVPQTGDRCLHAPGRRIGHHRDKRDALISHACQNRTCLRHLHQ